MWLGKRILLCSFQALGCGVEVLVLKTESSVNFSEMAGTILLMGHILPHFKAWSE